MFRINFEAAWQVRRSGDTAAAREMAQLLRLLAGIESSGSIASASRAMKLSYRHAWGMLRDAQALFGADLLEKQPGRGTRLSALGRLLLRADERARARLTPTLESLASELEAELRRALSSGRNSLRLFASHGFAVQALVEALNSVEAPLELSYRNSLEALAALARDECDFAGFHVPIGAFEAQAVERYMRWLDPARHALIHLAVRRQGLLVARGNPRGIAGLRDLAAGGVRFVNRQPGSGTRMLLELMLDAAGIGPGAINGFNTSEFTHAAVAAFVASGMADVGFGIEAAARRFGLDFIPLAAERYFFAAGTATLDTPRCAEVLAILGSPGFAARVAQLPGYDSSGIGRVLTVSEAFSR